MLRFGALFILLAAVCCGRPPKPQTDGLAFWYWHTPFQLSTQQSSDLTDLGARELYVRAATFSNDGESLVPVMPQIWPPGKIPFRVHLVYNMDSGALRHFEEFPVSSMAKAVTGRYAIDRELAGRAGIQVVGLQLDFDVATRLLPRYADLLAAVRSSIGPKDSLSITSLPTWFGSGDFEGVAENVDFYVPQFYDTSVPEKVDDLKAISDKILLEKGMEHAKRLGRPYFAGIASFGRALLYDPTGKLEGAYLGLSPSQAMRHPGFVLEKEEQTDQERILRFKAISPGKNGKGKGWYLVFRIPKPAAVLTLRELVRAQGGDSCRGAILFRVPEPMESMAVPLTSIHAQMQGKSNPILLDLSAKAEQDPWARIERQADSGDQVRLTLWFENKGKEPLEIGPKALKATLEWTPGSVLELTKGGFDAVELSRNGLKSSLRSADRVEAKRLSLEPGERVSLGPLILKRGTLLNCSWNAVSLSGVESSGNKRIDWNGREVKAETGIRSDSVR